MVQLQHTGLKTQTILEINKNSKTMNTMNKLKTVLILATVLFTTSLFTSCKSDDDDQDTIIGKWQLEQVFENEVEQSISDDCEKNSTLEFKTNNTFINIENYIEMGSCESSTGPGTWEYNGETALKIMYDGEDTEVVDLAFTFVSGNLHLVFENIRTVWKKI